MDNICKKFEKCPIYSGILVGKEFTSKSYKNQYCEAGNDGWESCKRYQVSEKNGEVPPDLLPNSKLSVDEIIEKMNKE